MKQKVKQHPQKGEILQLHELTMLTEQSAKALL